MEEFAYIRVSSKDQQEHRQVIAMENQGIPTERIFLERRGIYQPKRTYRHDHADRAFYAVWLFVASIFAENRLEAANPPLDFGQRIVKLL